MCSLQVAAQQGKYLAKTMNQHSDVFAAALEGANGNSVVSALAPFRYSHLGSMASVGSWKGVVDTPNICKRCFLPLFSLLNLLILLALTLPITIADSQEGPPVTGLLAFLLWRAAYWTKQVSLVNKLLIPMYWFKSMVFGRDISRF